MKVLTLTQPYATLIAIGAKTWETRSWHTSYRGPLAIHAAKTLGGMTTKQFHYLCNTPPFHVVLQHTAYAAGVVLSQRLPRGVILATCTLLDIVPTATIAPGTLGEQEEAFGDFSPGRYAWQLANVRPLPEPIPTYGKLGLWSFDHPVLDALATLDDASMA